MKTIGTHNGIPVRIKSFEKFSTKFYTDIHSLTINDLHDSIERTKDLEKRFDGYNDMCAEMFDYYHVLVVYSACDIDSIKNAYIEYKNLRTLDCDEIEGI